MTERQQPLRERSTLFRLAEATFQCRNGPDGVTFVTFLRVAVAARRSLREIDRELSQHYGLNISFETIRQWLIALAEEGELPTPGDTEERTVAA